MEPISDDEFAELEKKADAGELTQESLQTKLNEYQTAIRQEFETKTKASPENVEEYTREFFKENVHAAAAQIVWLVGNGESHSIQLRAAKCVVDYALLEEVQGADPIKELIKGLQATPK